MNVIFSLLFAQFFSVTKQYFGIHVPFFCFAVFVATSVIFIYKFVPETRGKTLEEIQNLLTESCKLPQEEQVKE